MTFDTPHGTRGARQPGGKLMAWMNSWNMKRIRGHATKVMSAADRFAEYEQKTDRALPVIRLRARPDARL
jgi:hypothetical protein